MITQTDERPKVGTRRNSWIKFGVAAGVTFLATVVPVYSAWMFALLAMWLTINSFEVYVSTKVDIGVRPMKFYHWVSVIPRSIQVLLYATVIVICIWLGFFA